MSWKRNVPETIGPISSRRVIKKRDPAFCAGCGVSGHVYDDSVGVGFHAISSPSISLQASARWICVHNKVTVHARIQNLKIMTEKNGSHSFSESESACGQCRRLLAPARHLPGLRKSSRLSPNGSGWPSLGGTKPTRSAHFRCSKYASASKSPPPCQHSALLVSSSMVIQVTVAFAIN
jgi:hypothetical protein